MGINANMPNSFKSLFPIRFPRNKMSEDTNIAVAIYDYQAKDETELSIQKNDKLVVMDDSQPWWRVKNEKNLSGYVPSNYLERKRSKKAIMSHLKTKMGKTGTKGNSSESAPGSNKVLGKTGNKILAICASKYNYSASRDDELDLKKGDQILVIEKENDGWWKGESNGKTGWFPNNYVEIIEIPPQSQTEYVLPCDILPPHVNGGRMEQVLCKVQTLYPFTSQSSEELSFEKGIFLDVIEKPKNDPDWWKARTPQGQVGLVPRNYVQEVEMMVEDAANETETQSIHPFNDEEWFHGKLVRAECEKLLHEYGKNGEFLLRDSESQVKFSLKVFIKLVGQVF